MLPQTFIAYCTTSKNNQTSNNDRGIASTPSSFTALTTGGLLIANFNRNGDYSIDKTEYQNGVNEAFDLADTNGNGTINAIEMEVWRTKAFGTTDAPPHSMFFDKNFNQATTRAEYDEAMAELFKSSDKDQNGSIEFSELVRAVSRPSGRRANSGNRQTQGRGRGGNRGGGRGGRGGGRTPQF